MATGRVHTGFGPVTILSAATSTGAGSWFPLNGAYSRFGLQVLATTGTTAYTVALQGTNTTATTAPTALISYTQASEGTVLTNSTLLPVSLVRANVSVLAGTISSVLVTATP